MASLRYIHNMIGHLRVESPLCTGGSFRTGSVPLFKLPGTCVAWRDKSLVLLHTIIFHAKLFNCSRTVCFLPRHGDLGENSENALVQKTLNTKASLGPLVPINALPNMVASLSLTGTQPLSWLTGMTLPSAENLTRELSCPLMGGVLPCRYYFHLVAEVMAWTQCKSPIVRSPKGTPDITLRLSSCRHCLNDMTNPNLSTNSTAQ